MLKQIVKAIDFCTAGGFVVVNATHVDNFHGGGLVLDVGECKICKIL
jgi:hypothetical protein